MEINITSLVETDLFQFSHSAHEGGENAGRNTWNAAKDEGTTFLDTDEKKEAFRDFVQESGGWTRDEINGWTSKELNALFFQWVAGDVRESPAILEGVKIYEKTGEGGTISYWYESEDIPDYETGPYDSYVAAYECANFEIFGRSGWTGADSLEEIDWKAREELSNAGTISGSLFQGTDGDFYFYIGN